MSELETWTALVERHEIAGTESLRLGLVRDGERQLYFSLRDLELWSTLLRQLSTERGEGLPNFVRALDEGSGPFRWKANRLLIDPADGRALVEILPMVSSALEGRDSSAREVLELALALFQWAEKSEQELTLERL